MQKVFLLITALWILPQSSFAKKGLKTSRSKYPCALCKYDIESKTSSNVITITTDKEKQEGDYKSYNRPKTTRQNFTSAAFRTGTLWDL